MRHAIELMDTSSVDIHFFHFTQRVHKIIHMYPET